MRLKIPRKWMYRCRDAGVPTLTTPGSTDARDARFSRIFDACGMHRRRNIIYILCERWQSRELEPLDAFWLHSTLCEKPLPAARRRDPRDSLPSVEKRSLERDGFLMRIALARFLYRGKVKVATLLIYIT